MIENFSFAGGTKIAFGPGRLDQIGAAAALARVHHGRAVLA